MSSSERGPGLSGRRSECETLDHLLVEVRAGRSRALVVRGEAGIGKTALAHYAVQRASGCRVARAVGVESEMEIPFAALHQLCAPFLDRLDHLPGPQRDALGTAFGRHDGDPPDRFLVGLAVLSLLSDVAGERPLLCVVDDAQWLDRVSAQALAFMARRLLAESVALVFVVREPGGPPDLVGLPELVVPGLADADARALLASVVPGPLDERVRDRIVAETGGNPLALLELPRGMTPGQLAGGFGRPDAPALAGRIEDSYLRRLALLPPATRLLLLIAAAEPVGDSLSVWRAAHRLAVDPDAVVPAVAAGLVEPGGQVRFRHPLARSAVYRAAPPADRRRVHRALAESTDREADADRVAWHRAQAALGPDEDVAAALERSADRARARGGLAAAAAFHRRASELTPEPAARARRALTAAGSTARAGAPDLAQRLLTVARAGPLDEREQARAALLGAQLSFTLTRGREAPRLLLEAARRLEPLDPVQARATYLDAFSAALFAGGLTPGGEARSIGEAVLAADRGRPAQPAPGAAEDLLRGLALLTVSGYAAGVPALARAVRAFRTEPAAEEDALRRLWLAGRVAGLLRDDAGWDDLTERLVRLTRRAGALSLLPLALVERFGVLLLAGDLLGAAALEAEARAVTAATGSDLAPRAGISLAAWRGDERRAVEQIEASLRDAARRGEGRATALAEYKRAVLYNGLGRYADALAAAERAADMPDGFGLSVSFVSPELVEAAVRAGSPERAAGPLLRLGRLADVSGTDWALGIDARCRALVGAGPAAEALYRESVERLGRTRIRVALARTHLLYGEWLRREGRRADARAQLRTAHTMLAAMGFDGFAERARRELLATGETVRKRSAETVEELTAQEYQIARLARDGLSNVEIGGLLFLSPRTVEWHLRKVFPKLGISSRKQLRRALPDAGHAAVPA